MSETTATSTSEEEQLEPAARRSGSRLLGEPPSWLRKLGRVLRVEELLLLWTWLFCVGLILYSNTGGPELLLVFEQYVKHFGAYILVVFPLSRVAFLMRERFRPKALWKKRVVSWLVGPIKGFRPKRLERWVFRNAEELRHQVRPKSLDVDVEFLRGMFILFVNLTIYTNIKTRIPFMNEARYDGAYLAMDRALFGKGLAEKVEAWFRNDPNVTQYFVDVYMHHYFWMVVLVCVFYFRRDVFAIRWAFMSAAFVYIFAILISVAWPSLGPVFLDPNRFAWLEGTRVHEAQKYLAWYFNTSMERVNAGELVLSKSFAGIAAFPSLHVGHMAIMLWIALRTIPVYAVWMFYVTITTTLATIGFGWHWIVDAPGGAILGILVTEALYRIMRYFDKRRAAAASGESTHEQLERRTV